MNRNLTQGDLTDEQYREYDWNGRTYRINNPVSLFQRPGGTTHRVVDKDGVVHCIPAPGQGDCVLRWKTKRGKRPVKF